MEGIGGTTLKNRVKKREKSGFGQEHAQAHFMSKEGGTLLPVRLNTLRGSFNVHLHTMWGGLCLGRASAHPFPASACPFE
ncbi:winged helix-turn-helix domain-containing protein [Sesbania bispinosa]|nr:winged helix-turn-helix domain-containing protein [Sesbania bispinosa]